jgi:small subunit ribosomal protein S20|tara:strand:- start:232 stop:447 length:216 start_codon:yes stop_codon:yes gene_type:complete
MNAPLRSKAKSTVSKARRLIEANDMEAAEQAVRDATIALDKAAQKGALHANNASRRISRITRQLNKARDDK